MSINSYKPGFPALRRQQGLNGFLSFLRKAAAGIVGAIGDFVIGRINSWTFNLVDTSKIKTWFVGIQTAIKGNSTAAKGDTDITGKEVQLISQWVESKFKPFLETIIKEIGAAQNMSATSALTALNAVSNKIAIMQEHYLVAETTGLTALGVEQRRAVIDTVLVPIQEMIATAASKTGATLVIQNVTFPASSYSLSPLFTSTPVTTVTTQNYAVKKSSGTIKTIPTVSTGIIKTNPPVVTNPTTPVATAPVNPATPTNPGKTGRTIGLLLALAGGAYWAFGGWDKKKSSKAPAKKASKK